MLKKWVTWTKIIKESKSSDGFISLSDFQIEIDVKERASILAALLLSTIQIVDEEEITIEEKDDDLSVDRIRRGYQIFEMLQTLDESSRKRLRVVEVYFSGTHRKEMENLLSQHCKLMNHSLKPDNAMWIEDNDTHLILIQELTRIGGSALVIRSDSMYIINDGKSTPTFHFIRAFEISKVIEHVENITAEEITLIKWMNQNRQDINEDIISCINGRFFKELSSILVSEQGSRLSRMKLHAFARHMITSINVKQFAHLSLNLAKQLFVKEGDIDEPRVL